MKSWARQPDQLRSQDRLCSSPTSATHLSRGLGQFIFSETQLPDREMAINCLNEIKLTMRSDLPKCSRAVKCQIKVKHLCFPKKALFLTSDWKVLMRKRRSILSHWGGLLLGGGGWRRVLDRDLKEIREKNVRDEGRGIPGPQ